MSSQDAILAFDIGTSSLRTALFSRQAELLEGSSASRQYQLTTDRDGQAELDADALVDDATRALHETLASSSATVIAVAASSLWHSLVGLDERGLAITPVMTWADAQGARDLAALKPKLDEIGMHQRTGCMPHASFWPAKLLYLERARPELFTRVRYWVTPADYIYRQLAGVDVCAHGMATSTGLYDPNKRAWDDVMAALCGVDKSSLALIDSTSRRADPIRLTQAGLERLVDAEWYAAIGDGAASNLGSGGDKPGVAAINLGTSGAVRLLNEGSVTVPCGLFGYRVDEQRYLVGGAVSNLASLLQWCWRELDIPGDLDCLESALSRRTAPEHGLTVLPFLLNERAPRWRDDLTGCIFGIRQDTTALDITQAMLEAAWHRLGLITDSLARTQSMQRIVVSGGLAVSQSAMQRLSNILGRKIDVCSVSDASIRGAAVYVLSRNGHRVPSPTVRWCIRPDARIAAQYADDRDRHLEIEDRLFGIPDKVSP